MNEKEPAWRAQCRMLAQERAEKEVRGITDYSKLPLLLIDKEATKDANAKNGREQRA